MKTIRIFTTLALMLIATLLLADNDPNYLVYHTNGALKSMTVTLSPVSPKEADFEEVDLSFTIPIPATFFTRVAPVLPKRADFDDDILPVHVGKLIPALPMEADF